MLLQVTNAIPVVIASLMMAVSITILLPNIYHPVCACTLRRAYRPDINPSKWHSACPCWTLEP